MRKTLMTLLMVFTLVTVTASAQRNDRRTASKARTEKMAEQLAKDMELDEETAAWFKPIYVEMQDTLRTIRRTSLTDMRRGKKAREKMTDEKAEQIIMGRSSATEKEVALKRAYYTRMRERLSPSQLIKIFATPSMPERQRMPQNNGHGFPGGGPDFPGGGGHGAPF